MLPHENIHLRKEKAKENLKKIGEGLLIAGTIAGAVAREAQEDESSMEENSRWTDFSYADYAAGDKSIRCANCGNMDENTLFEESETIYCSKCCHRTRKDNGKDDLVECPYCHRMRDRTAMYCRWCNDSAWKSSTKKEFEEIDTILKDMGN